MGNEKNGFYIELQPITDKFVPDALEVCKLSMSKLRQTGTLPHDAMRKFADWIVYTAKGKYPIFVGFPLAFDWSFVNWYFINYLGENPFGISGIDTKSVWFGKNNFNWKETSKTHIKRALELNLEHTHNALDDAVEQAIIFEKILKSDTNGLKFKK